MQCAAGGTGTHTAAAQGVRKGYPGDLQYFEKGKRSGQGGGGADSVPGKERHAHQLF